VSDPGYDFVPLAPEVRRIVRNAATWARRIRGTLSGRIDLELTAQQPVHVGSGSKQAAQRTVVLRHARIRGGPGIPGSSVRGALRARYEAITRSCAPLAPAMGSRKIRSSTGIRLAHFHASAQEFPVLGTGCTKECCCPACALFGRMSLRSRIIVTDFACVGDAGFEIAHIPDRFEPNLHHIGHATRNAAGDAFNVREPYGRKFNMGRGPASDNRQRVEVLSPGAVLTGQLRVFNLTPEELGGVLSALGCDPPSAIKVGGGKSHGFGRMRCQARCHLVDYDAPCDPAVWRQRFVASPDRWGQGEDRLVAMHQGDC